MGWDDDQRWETDWWGDCTNTFGEEAKQITYAHRMGLRSASEDGKWPVYGLDGKSVIDIGGGPTSLLLKTTRAGRRVVAEPGAYPRWTIDRYTEARIELWRVKGEDLPLAHTFDEAWIYNVLQHVDDPAEILARARRVAPVIRLFEWIDRPPHQGHPHELTRQFLEQHLGGAGTVENMQGENGCWGPAFYGVWSSTA